MDCDAADATRQCLRVGARAVLAAHVSVETHIVEKRFDAMTDRFDEQVEAAVTRISDAAESLLDEQDGALPHALAAHRTELDQLLGDTFDPDSKRSVISLFEEVLVDAHQQQAYAMQQLIATDGEDSPLARLKRELVRDLYERVVEVRRDVAELSEKIAVTEAVAPVLELTTGKGFRFEDVLDACVEPDRRAARRRRRARRHGDRRRGNAEGRRDRHAEPGRLERLRGPVRARGEVAQADDAQHAEGARRRAREPRRARRDRGVHHPGAGADVGAVPLRGQQGDRRARQGGRRRLRAAARVHVGPLGRAPRPVRARRPTSSTSRGSCNLIDDASRAIERCTTIRKYHTQARKGIEHAGVELDALVEEVRESLDAIGEELARARRRRGVTRA